MAANGQESTEGGRRGRRILAWALGIFGGTLALVVGLSLWLTEPLEPADIAALADLDRADARAAEENARPKPKPPTVADLSWPAETLEGEEAKRLLLDLLLHVEARVDRITGYTATFRKQERINGNLRPMETLSIKVRHRPFAFYGKFLAPRAGKEVVYAEGHHDNKVIATGGGFSRMLIPRLAIDPNSSLALADSRHPITDAGLANLVHRLVKFRKLDLTDSDATTSLDRWTDETGRLWYRSTHLHTIKDPERPFARIEVLYDTASLFPLRITSYDWADAPSKSVVGPLAERYLYDDLQLDVPLTALDFDPANPNYAFHRF